MKNSLKIFFVSVLATWIGITPISASYWDNWFGPGTFWGGEYCQKYDASRPVGACDFNPNNWTCTTLIPCVKYVFLGLGRCVWQPYSTCISGTATKITQTGTCQLYPAGWCECDWDPTTVTTSTMPDGC